MAKFDVAWKRTLYLEDPKLEGKTVKDNNDARVRFGINEAFHKDLGDDFYTGDKDAALKKAAQIAKSEYWNPALEKLDSQSVANLAFDFTFNSNAANAAHELQKAINYVAQTHLVKEDNVIGSKTVAAANSLDEAKLVRALKEFIVNHYDRITENKAVAANIHASWVRRPLSA